MRLTVLLLGRWWNISILYWFCCRSTHAVDMDPWQWTLKQAAVLNTHTVKYGGGSVVLWDRLLFQRHQISVIILGFFSKMKIQTQSKMNQSAQINSHNFCKTGEKIIAVASWQWEIRLWSCFCSMSLAWSWLILHLSLNSEVTTLNVYAKQPIAKSTRVSQHLWLYISDPVPLVQRTYKTMHKALRKCAWLHFVWVTCNGGAFKEACHGRTTEAVLKDSWCRGVI